MKADPFAQLKLLDLAEVDATLVKMRHRRRVLTQSDELTRLESEKSEIGDSLRDARIKLDDASAAQAKAEEDVEAVRQRRIRDQERLDSGALASPKDLEHLQSEIVNLDRRINTLEDEELALMSVTDEAQVLVDKLQAQVGALEEDISRLRSDLDAGVAEVTRDLDAATEHRAVVAIGLPEDLLALYEKVRERTGSTGAALLRAKQCTGCMLSLDPGELSRIRSLGVEDVARCDECERILVRTGESGL